MRERITVKEAAERMGMCVPQFRKMCREGKFPFVVLSSSTKRLTYWVIRAKFERYMNGEIN